MYLKMGKIAALGLAAAALLGVLSGCDSSPKFESTTIELGNTDVRLEWFLLEDADVEKASFVTDVTALDLSVPGDYPVTLRYGKQEETVTLSIRDTKAPEAVFVESRTMQAGEELRPEDFVETVSDLSETAVAFQEDYTIPADYSDLTVTTVVTDSSGNSTSGSCQVSFTWMPEELAWEYGAELKKSHILYNARQDDALLDQADIDRINAGGIGTYTLTSTSGGRTQTCTVTVADTQGPELEVHHAHIWPQEYVTINDFIVSVSDPSGVASTEMLDELDTLTIGQRTMRIKAVDTLGNETIAETFIKVNLDHNAPVIEGLEDLTVEKNGTLDFEAGVTATDNLDGEVPVLCDASAADLTTAGVYYITYTAEDAAGNETSARRRVIVSPAQEDIDALVEEVAAELSDDPKEIRDFTWQKIRYSASWGEPHGVWHGFTNWSGNCYVHAVCLQALLDSKGYVTQLIWTRDESHYWVLVKLEDGWRHMDATPSEQHVRILYMTDWDRYSTLDGRDWDRSLWPKAE